MERKNVEIPAQDLARQRDFEERIREMFSARAGPSRGLRGYLRLPAERGGRRAPMGMLEACGFTFTQEPGRRIW